MGLGFRVMIGLTLRLDSGSFVFGKLSASFRYLSVVFGNYHNPLDQTLSADNFRTLKTHLFRNALGHSVTQRIRGVA